MKRIWLHYARNYNMGDMLNIEICKKIFKMEVRDSSANLCECVFVGSILEDFLNKRKHFLKYIYPVKVWGTGFISDDQDDVFFRKLEVFAVRGKKTLNRVKENKSVTIINEVLGDPGILSSELISKKEKKYDIGIVPHYVDKKRLPEIALKEKSYTIIDVNEEPMECVRQIAQCRSILSSSLHGLIIADSFSIPNMRLNISPILGDYKYQDYYSAYELEKQSVGYNPIVIDNNFLDLIRVEYAIKETQVEEMKQKLLKVFPYA